MEILSERPEPPYFLSYEVTEQDSAAASASFGTLTYSYQRRSRFLDVDLRVGDYDLDNSRPIRNRAPATADLYPRAHRGRRRTPSAAWSGTRPTQATSRRCSS